MEDKRKGFVNEEDELVPSAVKRPDIKKPSVEKPSIEKPSIEKPSIEKPSIEKPSIEKPSIRKPSIEKPSVEKPSIRAEEEKDSVISHSELKKELEDKEVFLGKSGEDRFVYVTVSKEGKVVAIDSDKNVLSIKEDGDGVVDWLKDLIKDLKLTLISIDFLRFIKLLKDEESEGEKERKEGEEGKEGKEGKEEEGGKEEVSREEEKSKDIFDKEREKYIIKGGMGESSLGEDKRMLLIERNVFEGSFEKKGLPSGVLMRLSAPVCNIGVKNHNGRVYNKDVWERVLSDSEIQEKIKSRALFGHADHPENTDRSSTEKVSHVITGMRIDGDRVIQDIDVLDTPYGRIVDTIISAGCKLGVSTRARGELKEEKDTQGNVFYSVIPEKFTYITTDFTTDPSTIGAFPVVVEKSIASTISSAIKDGKIDQDFAITLLEGMKSSEAVSLLESIKKSKQSAVSEGSGKDSKASVSDVGRVGREDEVVDEKKILVEEVEKIKSLTEVCSRYEKAIVCLEGLVRERDEEISSLRKKVSSLLEEVEFLSSKNKELDKKLIEVREGLSKELMEKKRDIKNLSESLSKLTKASKISFIEGALKASGLSLDESSVTLLLECSSNDEVLKKIEQWRSGVAEKLALREDSSGIKGVSRTSSGSGVSPLLRSLSDLF